MSPEHTRNATQEIQVNKPPIHIHDPKVRANLTAKVDRHARAWAATRQPPSTKEAELAIPLGSGPMTVLQATVPARAGVIDPDAASRLILARLDAWYAEWPPEQCDGFKAPEPTPEAP